MHAREREEEKGLKRVQHAKLPSSQTRRKSHPTDVN